MTATMKQRVAGLVTALIMAYILFRVLDRLLIVVWVHVPWWGLIVAALVLYLIIDHLVQRIFR
ncbi:MAG: hypothetical protein R3C14_28855 [Caldilineaceae bacterium]